MLSALPHLSKGMCPGNVFAETYFVKQLVPTVNEFKQKIMLYNWFTTVLFVQQLLHEYKLRVVGAMKKTKS